MKISKLLFLLIVPCFLFTAASANTFVEKNIAVVRILNKAAGKAYTLKLPVGRTVEYDKKLTMKVQTCKQTDPFVAENFFMFVEVAKKNEDKIFSGWMSRNEPGDNPLQNPDYDLWLTRCE